MRHPSSRDGQRGVAALFVTVLLCFAMVLAVAFAQRNVVAEERRSANDYRTRQAFEAAEAGLEWALARVDDPTRLDNACRPSGAAGARSWRERMLRIAAPSGMVEALTWNDAGTARPLQAACVRGATGWNCSCPSNGPAVLAASVGVATTPGFTVELATGTRPGLVRVIATGCTRPGVGGTCAPTSTLDHEAATRHEATWAWVPGLRRAPAAALTVRGNVDAGGAALGVHNSDRDSGGLALHTGGRIVADALRLSAPGGSSLGTSIASGDVELAALTGDRLFARYFGMDKNAWSRQPAVKRIACATDCADALAAAIAAGHRLVFVEGDLALAGPAIVGRSDAPVAIVASGALRLRGAVAIHGVVHGAAIEWTDAVPATAFVRGAALVDGSYAGNGAPDFIHDAALLAALKTQAGGFVRVAGSWKDF